MKKITSHLSENLFLYLVLLLISIIVIVKAILLNGCFAFDLNDDANHTFTGLYASKLLLGEMSPPYFNYFKNFGTPLMGDSITLPFAIQAIPYYLIDAINYPWVMTINRFLISFATLLVLVIYYRTFQISRQASFIASLSVFSNFGFYWHFAHHHYQLTILIAVCILLVLKKYVYKNHSLSLILIVGVLYAIMIYSVSPNLVLIGSFFFLLYPISLSRNWKFILACYAGFILGVFIALPQIAATILALIGSVRSGIGYAQAFGIDFDLLNLFLRTFFLSNTNDIVINRHVYYAVYLPLFIFTALIVGIYILWRAKRLNELMSVFFLGLVPVFLVWTLLINSDMWGSIPILKSTDVTRILWFSMIFSGISIGFFIDALLKYTLSKKVMSIILLLSVINLYLAYKFNNFESSSLVVLGAWAFTIFSFGYLFSGSLDRSVVDKNTLSKTTIFKIFNSNILILLAILSYAPVYYILGDWNHLLLCHDRHHHFSEGESYYAKYNFFDGKKFSGSRIAIDTRSSDGLEFYASLHGIHTAGARAICIDARLQNYLFKKDLITIDTPLSGYHFSNPGNNILSAKLGLKYFLTRNNMSYDGWTNIGRFNEFYVYENKLPTSIVYARSKNSENLIPIKIEIKRNKLTFDTTGNEDRVTITLSARPGFLIYFNNKLYPYAMDSMGFILVDTPKEAGHFSLVYSPFRFIFECIRSGFNR